MDTLDEKFDKAIENIKSYFVVAQAMAKNEFAVSEKNIELQAENNLLKEKINLAIGGIDALCLMTDNNPGYEDFQAVKQTLEGE